MKVVIYTKTNCPYCVHAKNFLNTNNIKFDEVSLDDEQARQEFKNLVGPEVRTVPQIFVDGERIGGYQELIRSDILERKLD